MFSNLVVLFIAMMLTVGCGRGLRSAHTDQGDFSKYVDQFEEAGRRVGRDLRGSARSVRIEFGELKDDMAYGECRWHLIEGNRIFIDEKRWMRLDEPSKQSLIFHELGHCALGRHHDDDEVIEKHSERGSEIEYPKSLMNTILVGGAVFNAHRDYYEHELFGK